LSKRTLPEESTVDRACGNEDKRNPRFSPMKLLSLQIGMPRTMGLPGAADPMDREWTSGIFKDTVSTPVQAGPSGLAGDGQADRRVHGGPDKAINVYPSEHFALWHAEFGRDFRAGGFGENFTTQGALESDVCIGDIFQLGGSRVQITQPRQPCWKLARRWQIKELAARVEQSGRTGWYFRVLEPGTIEAPADFLLLERAFPKWTVTEANRIMHQQTTDWAAAGELAGCPALSSSWRTTLAQRAALRADISSAARRLGGG
jgi:MOSC domain-containing protein YiiM